MKTNLTQIGFVKIDKYSLYGTQGPNTVVPGHRAYPKYSQNVGTRKINSS